MSEGDARTCVWGGAVCVCPEGVILKPTPHDTLGFQHRSVLPRGHC